MKIGDFGAQLKRVVFGLWLHRGIKILIISTALFLPTAFVENRFSQGYLPDSILSFISCIPKDSYYWLFSSIAQSIAALFGIGGLFAAHLFQSTAKKVADAYIEAKRLCGLDPASMTDKEFYAELQRRIEKPQPHPRAVSAEHLRDAKQRIDGFEGIKMVSVQLFRTVAVLMTCTILLALIALPLSPILAETVSGIFFALSLLILVALSLSKTFTFVLAAARS